jgi:DNA-directed RNA polymerase subunit delta
MDNRSNLDIALELLDKKGKQSFKNIWDYVCEQQNYTEDEKKAKVGKFYTNLSLDSRFVQLQDNVWNLRSKETFDKVHIDIKSIYSDDEDVIESDDEPDEDTSLISKEDEDDSSDSLGHDDDIDDINKNIGF